jgi:hypothetical protein
VPGRTHPGATGRHGRRGGPVGPRAGHARKRLGLPGSLQG